MTTRGRRASTGTPGGEDVGLGSLGLSGGSGLGGGSGAGVMPASTLANFRRSVVRTSTPSAPAAAAATRLGPTETPQSLPPVVLTAMGGPTSPTASRASRRTTLAGGGPQPRGPLARSLRPPSQGGAPTSDWGRGGGRIPLDPPGVLNALRSAAESRELNILLQSLEALPPSVAAFLEEKGYTLLALNLEGNRLAVCPGPTLMPNLRVLNLSCNNLR